MKVTISMLVLLFSLNSLAASQTALTITNDIDTNIITISVEDNDGKLTSVRKVEKKQTGLMVDDLKFNMNDLYKGSVVQIKSDRPVVKIRMDKNFDPTYGGPFVLDYLYSGISGERRSLELDLRKNGMKWEVTMNNKVTSKLHVLANRKIVIGVIGISKIQSK